MLKMKCPLSIKLYIHMKRLFILLSLTFAFAGAFAQTVDWLVLPQYSEIKYFGPQMYKVTKNSKVGLIGSDGTTIIPAEYDAISLFYEGRAVFVNKSAHGWKIMGVVSDNGIVKYATGDYYLLKDYMFFSEGFITVRDENGRYGYLNENCQPAFEFTNDEVRPFSEGFAAIGSEDTFHWINTSGEQILPRLKNGGTPYGGTNFYNGKAYLWDEDGEIFELGADGKQTKMPKSDSFVIDYLYRVGSEFGDTVNYTSYEQSFSSQWKPECRNRKWTYLSSSGKPLSPFQYDKVKLFSDGSAVASIDGYYGLLQVVQDNSTFSTKNLKSSHIFSAGSICNCEFQLSVPKKWRDQPITVLLTDSETGAQIAIENKGKNNYTFSYKPNSSSMKENKEFKVEVKNNGIQLWQGQECFTFVQRTKLSTSIRVNNADAYSNDKCLVTATIKNPSPIDVTTTVTLSGGGSKARFDNKTVTITIPAHSSRTVSSHFLVRNVELNGWCAVSTSDGTSAKRNKLELKPF